MRIKFKEAFGQARQSSVYWTERAILDFTSALWSTMKRRDINQTELAKKVGKSPAYVSRVLNGAPNVTIRTMVELAHALDSRLTIGLVDEAEQWSMHPGPGSTFVYEDQFVTNHQIVRKERFQLAANEESLIAA